MKITIIGSSVFAKEMVECRDKLIAMGHENNLHEHYVAQAKGEMKDMIERMHKEHANVKIENDYIRYHYNEIVDGDAVIVLNYDKNGVENYIGGNTLMELGFAYVHNKKIFFLNPIPEMSYTAELLAVQPIILNGNISNLERYINS